MQGDSRDNTITISGDASGKILVNGGAVPITGGTPTVASITLIEVFGQGGNDTISLDETNGGALPPTYSVATATTLSLAAAAQISSSARPATTRFSARGATTSSSAATATTP